MRATPPPWAPPRVGGPAPTRGGSGPRLGLPDRAGSTLRSGLGAPRPAGTSEWSCSEPLPCGRRRSPLHCTRRPRPSPVRALPSRARLGAAAAASPGGVVSGATGDCLRLGRCRSSVRGVSALADLARPVGLTATARGEEECADNLAATVGGRIRRRRRPSEGDAARAAGGRGGRDAQARLEVTFRLRKVNCGLSSSAAAARAGAGSSGRRDSNTEPLSSDSESEWPVHPSHPGSGRPEK